MTSTKMDTPFMLDSGAFSAWRQGGVVDLEKYIELIKRILKKYPKADFEYANLDVIGDGEASYQHWLYMREEGLSPIPIYHAGTPEKYLEWYLEKTDRIGIGRIARLSRPRRRLVLDRLWNTYFTTSEKKPSVRVHGMGLADFGLLVRYPWWSVDTTSWLLAAGMGDVYIPRKTRSGWEFGISAQRVQFTGPVLRWNHGEGLNVALSALEHSIVEEYLSSIGWTVSELREHWKPRAWANIHFFWEFANKLAWPRLCLCEEFADLWGLSKIKKKETIPSSPRTHTTLFLSGSRYWKTIDQFVEMHSRFKGLGRLASFWEINTPVGVEKLLEEVLEAIGGKRGR